MNVLHYYIFFKNKSQSNNSETLSSRENRGYLLFSLIFTLGAIEYAWMDEVHMFYVWILL